MDATVLLLTAVIGFFGLLAFYVYSVFGKRKESEVGSVVEQDAVEEHANQKKDAPSKKKSAPAPSSSKEKDKFSHPWLLTTLKGHTGRVAHMDLSENGKLLVSVDDARGIMVWPTKALAAAPVGEVRSVRGNVTFDHASKVCWAPDSKAFVVNKAVENCCEVYKIGRKEDGSMGPITNVLTFPRVHETDVVGLGFASTGKFVMSCSDKTTLTVWSIRGQELASVDTYLMSTYCAKVTPCGRFVAASGFAPDVKFWEVRFGRGNEGEFEKLSRAFELTGHGSGVFHFDFDATASRAVTICKDGKWRLFDISVDFTRGQSPSLLSSGAVPDSLGLDANSVAALSPDASVVALGLGSSVVWLSASDGQQMGKIDSVHSAGRISTLVFDREARWLLTCGGDRHIRVLHNVPGRKASAANLKKKLAVATTDGARERITQQIEAHKQVLIALGEKM